MALFSAVQFAIAMLALSVSSASADCGDDIGKAGSDIGQASAQIVKMSTMCWTDRDACSEGAQTMVQAIGSATQDIAQAVSDCSGYGDVCTAAVQKIGDAIGSADDEAAKIAQECGPDKSAWSCVSASLSFAKTLTVNIASAIPQVVQDCSGQISNSACGDDIVQAGNDIGQASAQIVKMSTQCWTDPKACHEGAQTMVQAIGSAEKDIAQAVSDCGGQSAVCTAAIQKIGDAIASADDEAAKISDECGFDKPAWSCVSASLSFAGTLASNVAGAIPQVIHDCSQGQVFTAPASMNSTGTVAHAAVELGGCTTETSHYGCIYYGCRWCPNLGESGACQSTLEKPACQSAKTEQWREFTLV